MLSTRAIACLASVLFGCSGVVASPRVVWQIGAPDGGYAEFAIAGNYGAYAQAFRHDPDLRAGSSVTSAWPYIHPGPVDAWAGSRVHRFRVRFDLSAVPGPVCRLTIRLVNTHYSAPPTLAVGINGRTQYRYDLPAGGPDASLADPSKGSPTTLAVLFPSSLLRRGANALDLSVVAGSWLLYDSVTLEGGLDAPSGPVLMDLRAECTMLFRRTGGGLRQIVQAQVRNDGIEGEAVASLSGDPRTARRVHIAPGVNRIELPVDPIAAPRDATVELMVGQNTYRATVRLMPQRRWTVFVAPSSHTDIGYTDLQERAVAIHLNNTVEALIALRTSPDFRWNLEVAYHANLLRAERPDLVAALERAIRKGSIGLQGFYLNMLTGLCSSEEMVRVLSPAAAYRRLGRDVAATASLNDVPTAIGTMPTILRHAGYRYFTDAVNEYRGPVFRDADPRMRQSPFWWEGPDGSRVLAILTHGYAQASSLGFMDSPSYVAQRLPAWLRGFDRPDYPGDAVLAYGGVSDNNHMTPNFEKVVRAWNRAYAYPKIVLGSARQFFERVERTHGERLPVFKGDFGVYWEDGAGSSAFETALTRHARARLSGVQRILALSRQGSYLRSEINRAWQQVLFYNEHTWGAWCSVSAPDSDQTREQWARKAAFAYGAHAQSEALVGSLGATRARGLPKTVRVWNTLSWPRDITVTVPLTDSPMAPVRVTSVTTGSDMPSQVETTGGHRLVFVARRVPALSCADFTIAPGGTQIESILRPGAESGEWVTPIVRLRIDPASGAITSLQDQRTRREWVAMSGGLGLNQFLYVVGGEGSALINQNGPQANLSVRTNTRSRVALVENGPVRAILHVERRGEDLPDVDSWVIVDASGRVHLRNVVHKSATTAKEAGYFAFPAAVQAASSRAFVDVPFGFVEAERSQLAGACRDWYACSTHAAIADAEHCVTVAMPHSPLVTFGDIFRGLWLRKVEPADVVFAYAFNNYWDTNYCARQAGPLVYAFSLDLAPGSYDPIRAARFGQECALAAPDPARARWQGSVLDGSEFALVDAPSEAILSPPISVSGAEVFGIERDGEKLSIHLLNLSAQPTHAELRAPWRRSVRAFRTNLVGERPQSVPIRHDGSLSIEIGPYAPATVHITLGASPSRPSP